MSPFANSVSVAARVGNAAPQILPKSFSVTVDTALVTVSELATNLSE